MRDKIRKQFVIAENSFIFEIKKFPELLELKKLTGMKFKYFK